VAGVVVVCLVAVLALGGGGDDEPTPADQPPKENVVVPPDDGAADAPEPRVARKDVRVAVFNGTTVSGLADRVADDIEAGGFARDQVANASTQDRSATIVFYAEGARAQGRDVAEVIKLGTDAIQPMDSSTRTLDDDADVIVIVGSDQQQSTPG
jgi:hypothetical protein